MSLREKLSIINSYYKKVKKSISDHDITDIFLIICVFVLIVSPLIFNAFTFISAKSRQNTVYLSSGYEEFFSKETMRKLIHDFEGQNPDLKIKVFYAPEEKGPKEADILIFERGGFHDLIVVDTLTPLVSFMDVFFYNIELLQAAGFDRPPKTRAELVTFARAVSNSEDEALADAHGFAMGLSPHDMRSLSREVFSWLWSAGNNFWSEETGFVFNTRPIVRDITFLGSLFREDVLAPDSYEQTEAHKIDDFAQGKVAMMIASSRAIPVLREKMGDDKFGITTIPDSGQGGKYSIGLSGIYAGININCEKHESAMTFLSFLTQQIPLFCAELKAVPGDISDVFSSDYKDYMKDDPFYTKAWAIFEASQIIYGFFELLGREEYESIIYEELKSYFDEIKTSGTRAAEITANKIQERFADVVAASAPAADADTPSENN
jgi:ABC-type glycerol-3-phosphate transport system substrate-binding protein